jgi:hypothetical protein
VSLKISEFHTYGNNERNTSVEWLVESFENNSNLRKLFINPFITNIIQHLSNPSMLKMIARLHSVELAMCTHSYTELQGILGENIFKIIRALPNNSYVNIEHLIVIPETETVEDADKAEMRALSFWIKISDQTRKRIRLYARTLNFFLSRGENKATIIPRQAMDGLQQEFAGIRMEHLTDRTIFKFNDAKVSLFFKLLAWKRYLTTEYVSKNLEHTG